jgi:hypothetical protein
VPVFLFFGILFGFLLSRAGATNFDFHAQLFLLENLQLLWVIDTAAAVGTVAGTYLHGLVHGRMRPAGGAALASAVSTDWQSRHGRPV